MASPQRGCGISLSVDKSEETKEVSMSVNMTAVLETTAKRLFPDKTLEQALAQLLLERAQKNLIKYQSMFASV